MPLNVLVVEDDHSSFALLPAARRLPEVGLNQCPEENHTMYRSALPILVVAALSLCLHSAAAAMGGGGKKYEITITNLTRWQVITPPVAATHESDFRLFVATGTPTAGLEALAEDGLTGDLVAELEADPRVGDVAVAGGPILPGEYATLTISRFRKASFLSVVGMLATTNDAFFASQGIELPEKWETVDAIVYDAGTEANTENCAHIPGPPCGNPGVSPIEDGEGFIHVHSGIHGVDELKPEELDWRGPAARISIRRVR